MQPLRTITAALIGTLLGLTLASQASEAPPIVSGKDVITGKTAEATLGAAGKATVIVFVSATCPCSASHEPGLKDIASEFSGKGFQFIAVHSNADESAEVARAHFAESKLPFPVISDPEARLANALGARKTPHVFVISPKREILFQGGVDDSHVASEAKKPYLRQALAAIARGERPDPAEARTLGCVIKRI